MPRELLVSNCLFSINISFIFENIFEFLYLGLMNKQKILGRIISVDPYDMGTSMSNVGSSSDSTRGGSQKSGKNHC